jgi:hypothetical protein
VTDFAVYSIIIYSLQIDCGKDGQSHGRRKRDAPTGSLITVNGTKVISVNRSEFENANNFMEMPLEFVMIVRNPSANSDRLVLGDGKILVAGYGNFIFSCVPFQNIVCFRFYHERSMLRLFPFCGVNSYVGFNTSYFYNVLCGVGQAL